MLGNIGSICAPPCLLELGRAACSLFPPIGPWGVREGQARLARHDWLTVAAPTHPQR
jgi:hypothetical protein